MFNIATVFPLAPQAQNEGILREICTADDCRYDKLDNTRGVAE